MWMEILYRMLIQMDLRLNMRSLRIQIRNPLQSIVFQTMLERETWLIQMRKNTRAQAKDSVATEEPVEHAV
jgi:DNA-binding protein H-NS